MYKKVYVEITNACNLSCSFCAHSKRHIQYMKFDNFKIVLEQLRNHTKYLYLHVLGEPLMHPNINEFIDYAAQNYFINITTNGYMIDKIKNNKNIRQINISLHSFNPHNPSSLEEYLTNIFSAVEQLKETTYISYRLWVENEYTKEIIDALAAYYNVEKENLLNNQYSFEEHIFLNKHSEFMWPKIGNDLNFIQGTCYALKDHIAILVDGSVVPCCLDADGTIVLGNIYQDKIIDIITSKRYQKMLDGFKNNIKCEQLCQNCSFIEKDSN